MLIVALYQNNILKKTYKKDYVLEAAVNKDYAALTFTLPDNVVGYTINTFVWQSLELLLPIPAAENADIETPPTV